MQSYGCCRAQRAEASYPAASCGSASHPHPGRKADPVLAPNQNIENNPLQSNRGRWHCRFAWQTNFDTSGKSAAHFHYRAIIRPAHGPAHRVLRVIADQKFRPLNLHWLAVELNEVLRLGVDPVPAPQVLQQARRDRDRRLALIRLRATLLPAMVVSVLQIRVHIGPARWM